MTGDIELEQRHAYSMYNGAVGLIHTQYPTTLPQKPDKNTASRIRKRSNGNSSNNNNKDHRPLLLFSDKTEQSNSWTVTYQDNYKNNKSDDDEHVENSRKEACRTEQQQKTTSEAQSITRMASLLYDTLASSSDDHHTYHPIQDDSNTNGAANNRNMNTISNSEMTTQVPNQPTGQEGSARLASSLSRSSSLSSSPTQDNNNNSEENECLLISYLPLRRTTSSNSSNNNDNNTQRSSSGTVPTSWNPCCCCSSSTTSSTIRNRNCGIVLFGITTVLLFADQNLMAPNLSAIADDFDMTDIERDVKLGGQIAFAFFMIGAPASLLFGYLTDHPPSSSSSSSPTLRRLSNIKLPRLVPRFNRRTTSGTTRTKPSNYRIRLFATTVIMGETACFMTAFVQTYRQLFVCRALTGFSIGGAFPILYSLLGDWYEPQDRHWVNALTGIGTGAGIAIGQFIAGFLGPVYGWRLPFIIVSLPAILLAVLITAVVHEPERGATEGSASQTPTPAPFAGTPIQPPNTSTIRTGNDNDEEQQQQELNDDNDVILRKRSSNSHPSRQDINTIEITKLSNPQSSTSNDNAENTKIMDDNDTESSASNHNRSNSTYTVATQQSLDHSIIPDNLTAPTSMVPTDTFRIQSNESPNTTNTNNTITNNYTIIPNTTDWKVTLRILFTTPTVILAFLQGAPGCIPWGVINTYLNDYLSSDRGMSVQGATTVLLFFGLANFFGQLFGGVSATYLYKNYDIRYPALLACSSAILGCIPFYFLLHIRGDVDSWFVIGPIAILAGLCSSITGPIIKATLQNVTMPHHRGQAFGLFNIADDFGRGLGPVYVAGLIQITKSRTVAFSIGTIGWVICGLLNGLVYFFVRNDEQKVQDRYAQYLESFEQQQQPQSAAVVSTSIEPTTSPNRTTTDRTITTIPL